MSTELNSLTKLAESYSQILSTPFLPLPRIRFIKESITNSRCNISENRHSLIYKVKGQTSRKLVLMSHLDHPGIILKNRHEGICLGSLYSSRLQRIIKENGYISLDIYSPVGKKITSGKLVGLEGKYLQKAIIKTEIDVPPNSSAYYKIGLFKEDKNSLHLYASDNDIPTICLINLLNSIKEKPYFSLYVVFTFYEEVHQISSFNLASRNLLNLNKNDFVLNLESKKVENHPLNPKKNLLDYESGLVLQPTEKDCLYGYNFKSQNMLEKLILSLYKKKKINLQYGLGLGSTDARPFSNFKITPHICTLDVPNRYKHNCKDNGEITLEKVYKKDIMAMYQAIKTLVGIDANLFKQIMDSKQKTLSDEFKMKDLITQKKVMRNKILLNNRLEMANKFKIQNNKYYQTNLIYQILDILFNLLSYPYYYFLKFTQTNNLID